MTLVGNGLVYLNMSIALLSRPWFTNRNLSLKTQRKLMAVGAHADDVELRTGGTLAKYHAAGYEVVYVMSTNNFSGNWKVLTGQGKFMRKDPSHVELMPQRKLEAANGAKHYGTTPIHLDHPQHHYPLGGGDRAELRYGCKLPEGIEPDIPTIITAYQHEPSVQRVTDLILEHQPEAVFTHGTAARNVEHYCSCMLVTRGYWKAVDQGYRGLLLQWLEPTEMHGKLNSQWDTHIDISAYQNHKRQAIAEHACQIPDVNMIDLPQWGPACGCEHAEVFKIIAGQRCPEPTEAFSYEITKHAR